MIYPCLLHGRYYSRQSRKKPESSRAVVGLWVFDHEDIQEELFRRGLNLDKHGMNML